MRFIAKHRFPFPGQTDWPADNVTLTNETSRQHGIATPEGTHYPDIVVIAGCGALREVAEVETELTEATAKVWEWGSAAADTKTKTGVRHFFVYVPDGPRRGGAAAPRAPRDLSRGTPHMADRRRGPDPHRPRHHHGRREGPRGERRSGLATPTTREAQTFWNQAPMPTYHNKIAIIIRADLLEWQKLNVAAFLASSVAVQFPDTHGRPFVTASRTEYLPFPKNPMLIYKAENDQQIRRAFMRAKERGLSIGIYTKPLFATKGEEENLAEILRRSDEEQDLVGIVLYGDNKQVDKAIDGLKLHP